MAKQESALTAARPTAQLARRVLADLYQTMLKQESGALGGDIEAIHDMRVAIRRMRVALSNFARCYTSDERRRAKTMLEAVANALGGVRDLDVLIESLKSAQLRRTPKERAALTALIHRLQERRRRRYRQLMQFLHGEIYAAFKREFARMFDAQSQSEIVTDQPEVYGQAA